MKVEMIFNWKTCSFTRHPAERVQNHIGEHLRFLSFWHGIHKPPIWIWRSLNHLEQAIVGYPTIVCTVILHLWGGEYMWLLYIMFTDSLRYTSALSVALAVVFLVVTAGITVYKLMAGSITMPRLLPEVTDFTSVFKLFTVVPVLVTAYICHYNGMQTIHIWLYFIQIYITHVAGIVPCIGKTLGHCTFERSPAY